MLLVIASGFIVNEIAAGWSHYWESGDLRRVVGEFFDNDTKVGDCSYEPLYFFLFLDSISETPQFILSNHGKTQLVDSGGYIYYKSNQYNGKTSWKCTSYKMKCKARFTTDDVSLHVLKSNKEHNH